MSLIVFALHVAQRQYWDDIQADWTRIGCYECGNQAPVPAHEDAQHCHIFSVRKSDNV